MQLKECDSVNAAYLDSTISIFRSAYYLAKNYHPFSGHFNLLERQQLNGVNIGVGLHSQYSDVHIVEHVSNKMKNRIVKNIKDISGKYPLLLMRSLVLSTKSTLIVYMNCEVKETVQTCYLFLDLLEIPHKRLTQSLYNARKTIWKKFPDILVWHCVNHRLELAISDAVDEVCGVNNFQIFMDELYSLITNEPKTIKRMAAELDQLISMLIEHYMGLFQQYGMVIVFCFSHFSQAKEDVVEAPFIETIFILELAIMYDALKSGGTTLLTTISSQENTRNSDKTGNNSAVYQKLLHEVKVLERDQWPLEIHHTIRKN
ncbi:hypothetical protein PR048_027966 [Dryococelus australis]|uniref:DUF4371 domain-containing protein n=1 Tax=Dryococelus australis TaxID=614101 RepID=A0ABQ9GI05_9NEOP|nr:hypothetical protein PR048_027966 [Dryococelus australis]